MTLKIEYIKTSSIKNYAQNARTHSDEQVSQLVKSITEFGFTNPILIDEDGELIAGHGRTMAAKEAGLDKIPAIRLKGLTPEQIKALRIADNQLALNSGWDADLLALEIESLNDAGYDLDLIGFDDSELDKLLNEAGLIEAPVREQYEESQKEREEQKPERYEDDEDGEVIEPPAEPTTKLGDIWILGNHRLMCGDSTSVDAVNLLMGGNRVDLLFTDPPYNVAFNGRSGKHDVIMNDDLSDDEFKKFIDGTISVIKKINPPNYYIWCNWDFYGILQGKLDYKSCIVWAKNVFGMGTGYRHQHEFCLFNGKIDDHIKNESDLWLEKKDQNYVHPTQKPTALSERALRNHLDAVNILDLFGGSGSTLIGCEKVGRKAHLMELDPKYCDVIINRWETLTGRKAVLANE